MTLEFFAPAAPLGGGIRVITSTRHGGVSRGPYAALNLGDHVGDEPGAVAENRRRLARHSGCAQIQWLRQVHGTCCIRASGTTLAMVPEADAAWTDERGLGLAVLTADCVPVVVCAPRAGIIGIAHGGWRGLVGGVLESLVRALPVAPTELVAWMGPAIGPADYQVDEPVIAAVAGMADGDRLMGEVVHPDAVPDRWRLDLFGLAAALLERAGIARVESDRISSYADPRCFSHRRAAGAGGATGRMATLVWLPAASARRGVGSGQDEPSA